MKLISLILGLVSFSLSGQTTPIDSSKVNRYVVLIEKTLKARNILSVERERYFVPDILDEKLASLYALEIFKKQNPHADLGKNKYKVAVVEDSSKTLWISMMDFPNSLDGFLIHVFVKNTGQLIYYSNYL